MSRHPPAQCAVDTHPIKKSLLESYQLLCIFDEFFNCFDDLLGVLFPLEIPCKIPAIGTDMTRRTMPPTSTAVAIELVERLPYTLRYKPCDTRISSSSINALSVQSFVCEASTAKVILV